MVQDAHGDLSNDLHNLILQEGGEESEALILLNNWILMNEQEGGFHCGGSQGFIEDEDERGQGGGDVVYDLDLDGDKGECYEEKEGERKGVEVDRQAHTHHSKVKETHAHGSSSSSSSSTETNKAVNALALPEKADKTQAEEVMKGVPVLAHNDKSAMQAFEVAKEEAAGTETKTMLGDLEITLNSIKPKPTPVKTLRMTEESPNFQDASSPPPLSTRSPTSQFECDVMNATHQNLDFDRLQKSYSYSLMDEDKSISSEDSIVSEAEHTHDTDGAGAEDDEQSDGLLPAFVDHVLSPMAPLSDYMFCRMKSNLPDIVEDVSEFLSKDLHHLVFNCEGEEAAQDESVMEAGDDTQAEEKVDAEKTQEQEHKEGLAEKEEDGVETAWGTCPDGQGGGIRAGMQARFECASYNPVTGFVLRKEGRPDPAGDEVLIRVDATTISSRDCNERLHRDSGNKTNPMEFINDNTGLIEFWVPGHEIVGHVMRTGTDAGAENLLGKRVAALLPYGGGCSQYACVSAKDVIVLPVAANSTEVVALLSSYMAAYQCLDTVVGIEPKAEDGVESESEGDETEFQSVAVVPSDVDDDVKSNGESFDCSIASSLKEEDVEWERKGKIADDTESNLFSQQYNEEDSEHEPKEDERVTQKESTVDVEPKNEENIHGEEPKIKDDAKVNDAGSMKEDGNDNEVKPEEDDNVKPKAEEDTESESKAKGEEVVDVEVQDMSLVMNSGGPKLSPLYGMKVLVVGALSSVGLALVDLARNAGANVHTLSDSTDNLSLNVLRDMGARYWYPF